MTGRFVVIEGADFTGKSTQLEMLAARLRANDERVVETQEPGGTPLGRELRHLLLDAPHPVDARAEALLMAADRAQHVAEVVRPALGLGAVVVSSRFVLSSLVYQGVARALGVEQIAALSEFACAGVTPDLVVVLDVPDDVAEARRRGHDDRIEREDGEFHRIVREAYRDLARANRWHLVDAVGTPDDVHRRVWDVVRPIVLP